MEVYSCRTCSGTGRIGSGWFSGGDVCLACEGVGHVSRRQHACKLCKAAGVLSTGLGLRSSPCPACHALRYVMHAQVNGVYPHIHTVTIIIITHVYYNTRALSATSKIPCRKCKATGTEAGLLPLSSRTCRACQGQCYVHGHQHACKLCSGTCVVKSGWLSSK